MFRAPSRLRLLTGLAALLASTGLVAGSALPAAADTGAHHSALTYVALGDSYAAGQASDCSHTATSYPLRLDALHKVELVRDVSCAGATTSTVEDTQLRALNRGVRLVTVTVGANDLDVAGLAGACFPNPATEACAIALAAGQNKLGSLGPSLEQLYRDIAARAPHAEILVTGYPALVSSGPIADAEALLNATIARAVADVAATGVDIRYIPIDFTGHTVDLCGAPTDWATCTTSWFVLSGPNIFHPNSAGDEAIAEALAAAI